mmetsp:Transcript_9087/g.27333  ORF Transcript_9087/g.27333 Transcript_9087/m.27333 type:complete len:544 (+) Transcript_9087:77-1708(+)|eukprot:CAMPEP_0198723310 /NCGR_PEP_ID=MMETSP1475-20131203/831_1 /TAXON_ID= ORGANISM="Unidentified sp., Strain CCMP1999" /NCGR_SAMPLE_ID=MMETSP1475 /ASSEMBLY_ACC=CAM_ASM_001111 /LENGTH=543 /DNA_ID=CAMNT_0044484395 /DNA_START=33 /DNA_END=1664 /DNA_ORIENTATION=+
MAVQSLSIDGERQQGQDVRTANVTACVAIANIVKSSLGPVGLDKMLVDQVGDVTVTNDGATILKLLEVEHPAAKVLVELAQQQDEEVGDGTTSVVVLAAELLRRANDLVRTKIHPTTIMAGYRLAMREACKYIKTTLATPIDKLGREALVNAAKTSLNSKILGAAESDQFANMAVDAVQAIKCPKMEEGELYPLTSLHILKAQGKSAKESQILPGYALNLTRASQSMPTRIKNAKIALLGFDLRRSKMKMGVSVTLENPEEINKIQEKEIDLTMERIQTVLKAGANVILTTKGIDDAAMKYFVNANAIACRRVSGRDMRRIAKATGASIQVTLADLNGDETFDPSMLGHAEEVYEDKIRDDFILMIKNPKNQQLNSVILRGPNEMMCDEMQRSFVDATCVVKRMLDSNMLVPGGGATEAAVSVHLENFATMLGSREQLAIAEFAESLLVIPKTLAVNAAKDATDLVAKLRAIHSLAQTDPSKASLCKCGLDLVEGKVRNSVQAGVIEPAMAKIKVIQFATEAALTILRIDDLIKLNKKEEQQE